MNVVAFSLCQTPQRIALPDEAVFTTIQPHAVIRINTNNLTSTTYFFNFTKLLLKVCFFVIRLFRFRRQG